MDYYQNVFIIKMTSNELLWLHTQTYTHSHRKAAVLSGWLTFAFFIRAIDLRDWRRSGAGGLWLLIICYNWGLKGWTVYPSWTTKGWGHWWGACRMSSRFASFCRHWFWEWLSIPQSFTHCLIQLFQWRALFFTILMVQNCFIDLELT